MFLLWGYNGFTVPVKKIDSLNIYFFGALNSSGDGFSITPSAANLKTRYSDIHSNMNSKIFFWHLVGLLHTALLPSFRRNNDALDRHHLSRPAV